MDAPTTDPAASPPAADTRTTDLVLAGLHLRLGSLALARAELETLAGRDGLDEDGVLDLAEARWRTGDLVGAGEAARLLLDDDRGPCLALVIAAEAAMAIGRPTEARRYAARAIETAGGTLDGLFAGMPRAAVWPADPLVPPPEALSLFDSTVAAPAIATAPLDTAPVSETVVEAAAPSMALGLWDDPEVAPATVDGGLVQAAVGAAGAAALADVAPTGDATGPLPPGDQALVAGRQALVDGDLASAAVQLGLAIRLEPGLAPAVIDLLDDDPSPGLAFVRGDAYRLVGREDDARRAYAAALTTSTGPAPAPSDPLSLDGPPDPGDPSPPDGSPPQGDPA
jgi:hypothetical protein